jgi:hypothetical protein
MAAFHKTLIAQDKFEDFMSPALDQTPSNSQCERKTAVEKPLELEDSVLREKFDQMVWYHKIDERIEQSDLLACVGTIHKFYIEQ